MTSFSISEDGQLYSALTSNNTCALLDVGVSHGKAAWEFLLEDDSPRYVYQATDNEYVCSRRYLMPSAFTPLPRYVARHPVGLYAVFRSTRCAGAVQLTEHYCLWEGFYADDAWGNS